MQVLVSGQDRKYGSSQEKEAVVPEGYPSSTGDISYLILPFGKLRTGQITTTTNVHILCKRAKGLFALGDDYDDKVDSTTTTS